MIFSNNADLIFQDADFHGQRGVSGLKQGYHDDDSQKDRGAYLSFRIIYNKYTGMFHIDSKVVDTLLGQNPVKQGYISRKCKAVNEGCQYTQLN